MTETASRAPLTATERIRRVLGRIRRAFRRVKVSAGESPSVQILHGVKLYREIHIDGTVFRGTADTPGRTINYLFDLLPPGVLNGKTVLDLGTAGGAVCFEAVHRGARLAVGVETEERRIRGARYIKRRARQDQVQFIQQDFWEFFQQTRPVFDVIFSLNVLHHFANPRPLLRRITKAARERIVIEIPTVINIEDYNEYGAGLAGVPREGPIRSADDITRFLALYDFALELQRESPPETRFCGSDAAPRAVYIYARQSGSRVKPRDERLSEVEPYREARSASWNRARADEFNVDIRTGEPLGEILRRTLGPSWGAGDLNVILCGPPAAGKSHLFESAEPATHPAYNYKIFKFPNDKNGRGLERHLNPARGDAGKIAQVMLSTVDDVSAHCTGEELARAIAGRPVVCLVLNVRFEEHFDRLYRRQVGRVGTADASVDYEGPLQFDSVTLIENFKKHQCLYRVLTLVPGL